MLGAFPSLSPWKNLGQAGMSVSWFSSPARPVSGAPPWLAAASDSECAAPRGIPWIHWMIQAPGLQNHQVLVVLNDLSHPPCWNSLWTAVPLTLSSQPSWSGPAPKTRPRLSRAAKAAADALKQNICKIPEKIGTWMENNGKMKMFEMMAFHHLKKLIDA